MFALGAAVFGAMILMPLYWQELRGYNVIETGLLTGPQGIGMAVTMPLAAKLTERYGGGPVALVGRAGDRRYDDPVRADRRPHQRRLSVWRDGLPRRGHGRRLHAGDDRRVRGARAQRDQSTRRRS